MDESKLPTPEQIQEFPPEVREWFDAKAKGEEKAAKLDELLPGPKWNAVRASLQEHGIAAYRDDDGQDRFLAATLNEDGYMTAFAAAVPRQPGRSYDFLNEVEDFKELLTGTKQGRKDAIALFEKVYRAEGVVNVGIKRMASLVASQGRFKVRSVKGKRGVSGDKLATEFETALNWWRDKVNARPDYSVITGSRGVRSWVRRGTRLALIQGDLIARTMYQKGVKIPNLSRTFSLPMNLQSFSAAHIEAGEGLEGTDMEVLYWVPPRRFIQELQSPRDPNVGKLLKKMLGTKVVSELVATNKYLLDPRLVIHVVNGGTGTEVFGESVVEPALASIRMRRAYDALELTIITNLIARMVILKVGSDNKESVYHRQEVSASRLGLLQRIMRAAGPSATVLWAGPDLDVLEVSAHNALPDMTDRYKLAERRILMDLGLPAMLLIGEGGDGKAVANATALAVAAQLEELQDQFAQALVSLAERIAEENGYEEVDVIWEWQGNLLENKEAAAEMIVKLFQIGLLSTQTSLEELDFDYGAEEARQREDVKLKYKEKPFGPPLAMITKNQAGVGGEEGGRPTKEQNPQSDPREGRETGDTESQQ